MTLHKQPEAQFLQMGEGCQSESTPELAKVTAIASASAVLESRGLKERKPVTLEQMLERGY